MYMVHLRFVLEELFQLTSVVIMVSNRNFQTILQSKYFETFGKKIKICRVKWSKLKI